MMHDQILEQLKQFEFGQLNDKKLEEWLLSHLQLILDSREDRAIDLANELDALFIQEHEGLVSAEEMRFHIDALFTRELTTAWHEWGDIHTRAASAPTIHKQWGKPAVVTGLRSHQAA
jgi:hypothetical protein